MLIGWQVRKGVQQLTSDVLKTDLAFRSQISAYRPFWGAKTNVFEV